MTDNFQTEFISEDSVSFLDILMVIASRLRIIMSFTLIFFLMSVIYVQYFAEVKYRSTAKLTSSSGNSSTNMAAGLASQFGIDLSSNQKEENWIYPEIVKSRTLARSMLKRKFNTERYGSQKTLLQILTYGNAKPTVGADTLIKAGIGQVIKMIDLDLNGSFYDLTITADEPLFARDIASALIEELIAHQREYNKSKTKETRDFIESRIVDIEEELKLAEEKLKNFRDRNRRIENSPGLQLEQERLFREVSVLKGVFTTLKQQLETTKIEQLKESNYIVVLDPPEAPLSPSEPRKSRIVLLFTVLGLFSGLMIAFVKEYKNNITDGKKEKLDKVLLLLKNNFIKPPI